MSLYPEMITKITMERKQALPVPKKNAEDLFKGAQYIPDKVTMARRSGQIVKFVIKNGATMYWEFEDGTRINH